MCTICNLQIEDILHALRDCPATTALWRKLVPVRRRQKFFGAGLEEWIDFNTSFRGKEEEEAACIVCNMLLENMDMEKPKSQRRRKRTTR